jgi:uncharacterized membrane protein YgdD (TMEM256/DUF423 family)
LNAETPVKEQPAIQGNTSFVLVSLYVVGAVGVLSGAFGSHALRDLFDERTMDIWKTAVLYLFVHTLAGIFCETRWPGRLVGILFLLGILIFSGSLMALCISGERWLGAVTPVGGVLFVLGWLRAAWLELRHHD